MNLFRTTLLAASTLATAALPAQTVDTIYFHGTILTGAHLHKDDPSATPPTVTALAIASGKIIATGTDVEILKLKTPQTKLIDLQNAFAMPGFNDAHTHIANAGQQKLSADLIGTTSLADMQARIKAYAATTKPGTWLRGGGWDHTLWASKTLPTRADLDAVTAGHPAVFYRVDGHIVIANTAALAAASIIPSTPDPEGGKIDRDGEGTPTGIVREIPAITLIERKIPPLDNDTRRRALQLSIADALAHGVTSVQDFSEWDDFLVLEELEHAGKLKLRVSEWLDFNLPLPVLQQRRASHPADDPLLHIGMLKAFMDGSLGSRTAALEEPYADEPGNSGIPRYDEDKLNLMATERAAAGFQLGFHAIGDRANEIALNAFSAAEQTAVPANHPTPPNHPDAAVVQADSRDYTVADLRLRIEHAQVLRPEDFDRFARLGIIASMQPSHLLTDMAWATARLGPERAKSAYAWHSFLDHGVTLAFGTDYPVESINPFRGLYAATTRQNEAGTQTFQPQEKISIQEALYAYTQASAYAEFRDHQLGRLEPGYLADFVVLDHDPTTASPHQILYTRVIQTIVNGENVYTAPSAGSGSAH